MYLSSDLGKFFYNVYGPVDAPAIVLAHGVAMDHRTFAPQVAALREQYRVIVWDMPFHGQSPAIDKGLSFSRTAADLTMALMDELGIRKAVLAGLSLGSYVVQQAELAYPERVTGTIHISGGPLYPGYTGLLKAFIPFTYAVIKLLPTETVNRSFAVHKALTEDTIAYLMESTAHTGKDAIIHLTNEMTRDLVAGLPGPLTHPALMVIGEHDMGFIKQLSVRWHARQPNSRLVEVLNAHHIVNQDNPDDVNRHLLAFMHEITGP